VLAAVLWPAPPAPVQAVAPPPRPKHVAVARVEPVPVAPAPRIAVAPAAAPAPAVDPVLTALATTRKGSAVVFEANALRNAPVGQLALECFLNTREEGEENPLQKLRDEARVDITRDLDRVAVMDEGVVLTGHFAQARWDRLLKDENTRPRPYGVNATVHEPQERVGRDGRRYPPSAKAEVLATLGDNLVYVGTGLANTQGVMDTLEGRSPAPAPLLTPDMIYGDVYGVIAAEHVGELLPFEQHELAELLPKVMHHVVLHVDAARDVRVTAELKGVDPTRADELAAMIDAGLVLSRMKATKRGNVLVAKVLERLHLVRDGAGLRLEADVPLAMLEQELAWCRSERRADR
jgi:hypothetical protein